MTIKSVQSFFVWYAVTESPFALIISHLPLTEFSIIIMIRVTIIVQHNLLGTIIRSLLTLVLSQLPGCLCLAQCSIVKTV